MYWPMELSAAHCSAVMFPRLTMGKSLLERLAALRPRMQDSPGTTSQGFYNITPFINCRPVEGCALQFALTV